MRAYKGKVEAQPTAQPAPVAAKPAAAKPAPATGDATVPNAPTAASKQATRPPIAPFPEPASNTLPMVAIAVLSLIAIALVVALLAR
jgi:hypothetical protein